MLGLGYLCAFFLQDRLALLDQPPATVPSPHPCDEVYLTSSMVERVMCAVLKQVLPPRFFFFFALFFALVVAFNVERRELFGGS